MARWLLLAVLMSSMIAGGGATGVAAVFTAQRSVGGNTFATHSSFYRAAVLADGPAGYWRLGETSGTTAIADVGGNHGTYLGGVTLGAAAATADGNAAAGFDGVDDRVELGNVHDFPGTAPFSVEFWIKLSGSVADSTTPVSTGSLAAPRQGWQFWTTPANVTYGDGYKHTLAFQRWRDGAYDSANGTTQLAVGGWYHVVGSYDGATIRLYVNGRLEASIASTRLLLSDVTPLRFGSSTAYGYLHGVLDEVAIYNRALDGARIRSHFELGDGYRAAVLNDRPVSYWRMGETSGTTATDEMGVGNGTYQNGVTLGGLGRSRDSNSAAALDGVDDRVDMGDRFDFPGNAPFSFEAWVRPGSVTGDYSRIVSKEGGAPRQGWDVMLWPGGNWILLERWRDGAVDSVWSTVALEPHVWYHVAFTYDGATLRLYLNGSLNASAPSTKSVLDLTAPLILGTRGGGNPYNGTLDEVAIYDYALNLTQVQRHYNQGGSSCALPGTYTVTADRDSYVNQAAATTNYGTAVDARVQSLGASNQRALVGAALPYRASGCDVTAANLRLTAASFTSGRTLQAHRAGGAWTETGVNWNLQPAVVGTASTAASGATPTFDVTSSVRFLYAGSNNGFVVRDSAEANATSLPQVFRSREWTTATDRPQLTVTLG